jgi:hypothetical protein
VCVLQLIDIEGVSSSGEETVVLSPIPPLPGSPPLPGMPISPQPAPPTSPTSPESSPLPPAEVNGEWRRREEEKTVSTPTSPSIIVDVRAPAGRNLRRRRRGNGGGGDEPHAKKRLVYPDPSATPPASPEF